MNTDEITKPMDDDDGAPVKYDTAPLLNEMRADLTRLIKLTSERLEHDNAFQAEMRAFQAKAQERWERDDAFQAEVRARWERDDAFQAEMRAFQAKVQERWERDDAFQAEVRERWERDDDFQAEVRERWERDDDFQADARNHLAEIEVQVGLLYKDQFRIRTDAAMTVQRVELLEQRAA